MTFEPALPEPAALEERCAWAGLSPEDAAPVLAYFARLRAEPALRDDYERGSRLLYGDDPDEMRDWKPPRDEEAALCFLLALDALPRIRRVHGERGVPEDVTRAVCEDVGIGLGRWREVYGAGDTRGFGLERWLLFWYRLLASGELYRLGRLQFVREAFRGCIHAYRSRETGEVVALAADGTPFRYDGYLAQNDDPIIYTARLTETDATITGDYIPPTGLPAPERRTLDTKTWECVLRPGDPVLDIHIPEGSPLSPELCADSFAQAVPFFARFYPDWRPRAFVCHSWLLDPAWQDRLPPESNIVRFQRQAYLFPAAYGETDGAYFVFCTRRPDPATAPRRTRLQRAILDAIESGEPLRSGAMFLLFGAAGRRKEADLAKTP